MSGGTVKVRVPEHRAVTIDGTHHPAGAVLDLPAADAKALDEQGYVELVESAKPRRGGRGTDGQA